MPPPYRAQLGGIEGSGVYMHPSAAPDWAGIIQAASGGASSLLHNAMLRKVAIQNHEMAVRRLNLDEEMRRATLEATSAYRAAMIGNAKDRIAAPDARATKANKKAQADLQVEFPEHNLVAPDENGDEPQYDETNTPDFVGALKSARAIRDRTAFDAQRQTERIDLLNRAAKLRDWVTQRAITGRAAAGGDKPQTPAQRARSKSDFLKQVATLSGGDPEKASALIASDKTLASTASDLGVQDYEVRASAGSLGVKYDQAPPSIDSQGNLRGRPGAIPLRPSAPPPTAGMAPAPAGMAPAPAADARPSFLRAPSIPNVQAAPTAGTPGASIAPPSITPLATPGVMPSVTRAPAAVPPMLATPQTPPAMAAAPAPAVPSRLATPTPARAGGVNLNMKPAGEDDLSDADLWEMKRKQLGTPDAATAYVRSRKRAVAAPTAAPVKNEDDEALQPAGTF